MMMIVVAALAVGCSDDGDSSSTPSLPGRDELPPASTIDDSQLTQTPFCQNMMTVLRTLENFRDDPSADEESTLAELKTESQEMTNVAPAEIKDDVEALNQNVQEAGTVVELLELSPITTQLRDDIVAWVEPNCNVKII
jgi:hypothetical protein